MSYRVKGMPVSEGIAAGPAFVIAEDEITFPRYNISEDEIELELVRLRRSIDTSSAQLEKIREIAREKIDTNNAQVFDAHLMMLKDPIFLSEVEQKIRIRLENIETIVYYVMKKFIKMFESSDDEYLKERASDIKEVGRRIINNLQGNMVDTCSVLNFPVIIVAVELSTADLLNFKKENILGIITEKGGKTSHVAIFAKTYQIPVVMGVDNIVSLVKTDERVIIDAINGNIIVNPDRNEEQEFKARRIEYELGSQKFGFARMVEPITKDGFRVRIGANLAVVSELDLMKSYGIAEIGLYRTEYLFLGRDFLPSEEEQYSVYRKVAEKIGGRVVIRTLDVGGDKFIKNIKWPNESNPFLGWRAIRFCLDNNDIFITQMKALLRAAVHGNIEIMFPMITTMDELDRIYELIFRCKKELSEEKKAFRDDVKIGALIETPALGMIVDKLAKRVDFISIGTNDLTQFMVAVDRMNEKIDSMFDSFHPGVLVMIENIIKGAHEAGLRVGMCGEMAGNPLATELLLGMGLDLMSMNLSAVPAVKLVINSTTTAEARNVLETVKSFSHGHEIRNFLRKRVNDFFKIYEENKGSS